MKTKIILTALTLGASAWMVAAQEDGPKPPGGPGQGGQGHGQRMIPPMVAALDANHDGTIDADELANSAKALKLLDKDGDGKLSTEELRPARPEGGLGQGGPGKHEGQGGPGGDQQRPQRDQAKSQGGPGGPSGPGGQGGQGGQGHGQRPTPPMVSALDANHDGTIDADELANASAALKSLDKNGDGKLTREELMPARPQGLEAGGHGGEGRPPGGPGNPPEQ